MAIEFKIRVKDTDKIAFKHFLDNPMLQYDTDLQNYTSGEIKIIINGKSFFGTCDVEQLNKSISSDGWLYVGVGWFMIELIGYLNYLSKKSTEEIKDISKPYLFDTSCDFIIEKQDKNI